MAKALSTSSLSGKFLNKHQTHEGLQVPPWPWDSGAKPICYVRHIPKQCAIDEQLLFSKFSINCLDRQTKKDCVAGNLTT